MVDDPFTLVELTSVTPETPLMPRSSGVDTSSATICGVAPGYVAVTIADGIWVDGSSSCFKALVASTPKTTTAIAIRPTINRLARLSRVKDVTASRYVAGGESLASAV